MALNCIVIATKGLVPDQINQYLESARFFEVVGIFTNVADAREASRQGNVHYFLLDIETAQSNLSEMLLAGPTEPKVLIFSAEEIFYLENMKSGANSILLRDSEKERGVVSDIPEIKISQEVVHVELDSPLVTSLEKSLSGGPVHFSLQAKALQIRPQTESISRSGNGDSIFVRSEARIARIRLDELLFVEAQKDYVVFHTANEQYRVLNSMKRIESQLSNTAFFRIHRSFIVRLDKIHTIQADEVQLDDYHIAVPIGPSFKTKLMKQLQLL